MTYPGLSYPNHPFSEELGDININTWVQGVLAFGANLNLGSGPVPL
jgi:hypothetical protein